MMGDKKVVTLGSAKFEISNYVGKVLEDVTLTLTGGPLANGHILAKMSVVPIPQATSVGVDPQSLTTANESMPTVQDHDLPERSPLSEDSFKTDSEEE